MSKKYTAKNIKLDELVLDKENPRFAELYNGSDKEEEIIEYIDSQKWPLKTWDASIDLEIYTRQVVAKEIGRTIK